MYFSYAKGYMTLLDTGLLKNYVLFENGCQVLTKLLNSHFFLSVEDFEITNHLI